ncbi:hypothetical protein FA15DRAFT_664742 [Coprinopsis marcescibilis]|uniref:Uncharacterized protein n=1 Tax=Coprinopsis marcescibilis TaxID=230819 RepID=A0A5C3L8C9_COPMA|nr:hypothetical protein FA15DRAFT_664742 [Coprinopsis marcescibilis]
MPLSRLDCPSFLMVLAGPDGELVRIVDRAPACRRQVQFAVVCRPQQNGTEPAPNQPSDNSMFMRTVDARFEGNLAYKVDYDPLNTDEAESESLDGSSADGVGTRTQPLHETDDGAANAAPQEQERPRSAVGKVFSSAMRRVWQAIRFCK